MQKSIDDVGNSKKDQPSKKRKPLQRILIRRQITKKKKKTFLRRRDTKRIPKLQEKRKTDQPPCVTKF